jgi:hypothetical protein
MRNSCFGNSPVLVNIQLAGKPEQLHLANCTHKMRIINDPYYFTWFNGDVFKQLESQPTAQHLSPRRLQLAFFCPE